ncbi:MAG: hypothetical protein AUG48_02995 [Actinobacteria bacterium 13_1_20CM_3_68_9]|nr:MAG: hypothetical protein AUG48_02995 [Actinobacteria bacterium 13_1_20CM_3_68_9]
MSDEWRIEVDLDDEQHGFTLGERLQSLDLDDEARERLGDRVVVTRDGAKMFLYAATEEQAREAERVARDLIAAEGLSAEIALTRWHPDEEEWKDASVPMPQTDAERATERERHEEEAEREPPGRWDYQWEVRVDLPTLHDTREFASRLEDEGIDVRRHWKYLLVGAASEERAAEVAERMTSEAPEGSKVHVGTAGVPHPVFVYIEAHKPGIARDLGL